MLVCCLVYWLSVINSGHWIVCLLDECVVSLLVGCLVVSGCLVGRLVVCWLVVVVCRLFYVWWVSWLFGGGGLVLVVCS